MQNLNLSDVLQEWTAMGIVHRAKKSDLEDMLGRCLHLNDTSEPWQLD